MATMLVKCSRCRAEVPADNLALHELRCPQINSSGQLRRIASESLTVSSFTSSNATPTAAGDGTPAALRAWRDNIANQVQAGNRPQAGAQLRVVTPKAATPTHAQMPLMSPKAASPTQAQMPLMSPKAASPTHAQAPVMSPKAAAPAPQLPVAQSASQPRQGRPIRDQELADQFARLDAHRAMRGVANGASATNNSAGSHVARANAPRAIPAAPQPGPQAPVGTQRQDVVQPSLQRTTSTGTTDRPQGFRGMMTRGFTGLGQALAGGFYGPPDATRNVVRDTEEAPAMDLGSDARRYRANAERQRIQRAAGYPGIPEQAPGSDLSPAQQNVQGVDRQSPLAAEEPTRPSVQVRQRQSQTRPEQPRQRNGQSQSREVSEQVEQQDGQRLSAAVSVEARRGGQRPVTDQGQRGEPRQPPVATEHRATPGAQRSSPVVADQQAGHSLQARQHPATAAMQAQLMQQANAAIQRNAATLAMQAAPSNGGRTQPQQQDPATAASSNGYRTQSQTQPHVVRYVSADDVAQRNAQLEAQHRWQQEQWQRYQIAQAQMAAQAQMQAEAEAARLHAQTQMIQNLPTTHLTEAQLLAASEAGRSWVAAGCAICMEGFEAGETKKILPCLHQFHEDCVDEWLQRAGTCPVCKRRIDATEEIPGVEPG